jgi:predicted Zn finger-like uncharacterized protein
MIVSCPACSARLRLDPQRLGGKRVTLRCVRCRKVFKADVPLAGGGLEVAGSGPRVLIAHADQDLCAAIGEILAREGIGCQVCHDGRQALAVCEASSPQVAVFDVALPGLLAFELIDKVRRQPDLKDLRIILLSSVYNKTAYKRTPSSLYGADDYIEKHHISDDLVPKIHRLLADARPTTGGGSGTAVAAGRADDPDPGQVAFFDTMNSRILQAEKRETTPDGGAGARDKADRLARIIVADIALYNQERVDEGIRSGRFYEMLADEIEEGRRLFRERGSAAGGSGKILDEAFAAFVQRRRSELGL